MKCWTCGGIGHRKSECSSKGKDDAAGSQSERKKDSAALAPEKKDATAAVPTTALAVTAPTHTREAIGRVVEKSVTFASVLKGELPVQAAAVPDKAALVMNVDSGTSVTIVPEERFLSSVDHNARPVVVTTAKRGGEEMRSKAVGALRLADTVLLGRTAVIPDAAEALLSVAALSDQGARTIFHPYDGGVDVVKDGQVVLHGNRRGNKFELTVGSDQANAVSEAATAAIRALHQRLNHLSASMIIKTMKAGLVNERWSENDVRKALAACEVCALTKMPRKPVTGKGSDDQLEFGDKFCVDIAGPFRLKSSGKEIHAIGNAKYYLAVKEARSRLLFTPVLGHKNDAPQAAKDCIARLAVMSGRKLKEFHSDGDSVFTSAKFREWCRSNGILATTTTRDTPEHNSVAERSIRTLNEMVRAMHSQSGLPHAFWPLSVKAACYTLNRVIGAGDTERPPIYYADKTQPSIDALHPYGCDVVYQIPPSDRLHRHAAVEADSAETLKFRETGAKGVFVGYNDDGRESYYKVYDMQTRKVVKTRTVRFLNTFENAKTLRQLKQFEQAADDELVIESSPSIALADILNDDDSVEEAAPAAAPEAVLASAAPAAARPATVDAPAEEASESKQPVLPHPARRGRSAAVPVVAPARSTIIGADGYEYFAEPELPAREAYKRLEQQNLIIDGPRARPQRALDGLHPDELDKMPEMDEKVRVNWDPDRYTILPDDDDEIANAVHDDEDAGDTGPASFEEATSGADAEDWWASMRDEMKSQKETGSYILVPRERGMNVITSKWVYRKKRDENGKLTRKKSRFTPRGFQQRYGIDYDATFAPTLRQAAWRTVLSRAAARGMRVMQADVPTAFLKAKLHHEIYIEQPKGFVKYGPNGEELVMKLLKPVYGIKQAPREWHLELKDTLARLGSFKPCATEPSVYIRRTKSGGLMILLVWVDDMWLCYDERDEQEYQIVSRMLSDKYGIKKWEWLRSFIGLRVVYDQKTMTIDQQVHADNAVKQFRLSDAYEQPALTLDVPQLQEAALASAGKADPQMADVPYMPAVGSLMWLANQTRPDLAFIATALARYGRNPQRVHWEAVKKTLRYVKGTSGQKLTYKRSVNKKCRVQALCDSDWAEDRIDRRSFTGGAIYVDGNLVIWISKKQASVALSSSEAEYMAMCTLAEELKWLVQFLTEIGEEVEICPVIYTDNQASKLIAQAETGTKRTKHIDIRYHFIRNELEKGALKVKWIPRAQNSADLLTHCTKSVQEFNRLKEMMFNGSSPALMDMPG